MSSATRERNRGALEPLALLGELDGGELAARAQQRERGVGEPGERPTQRRTRRRGFALVVGHVRPAACGDQRRFIIRPATKPTAAATPIACHGLSWT